MEVVHGKYEQRNLGVAGGGQVRLPVRIDLQTPAKKLLGNHATCFVTGVERLGEDAKSPSYRVSGRVATRVVFIDEHGGFNSEEHTDDFSEKFTPKNGGALVGVVPAIALVQTVAGKATKNDADLITAVSPEHVINVGLAGVTGRDVAYVTELSGVEAKTEETKVATVGACLFEKFEISENFTLEQNVEGILGVEIAPHVRDIAVADGKITVKGVACVGIHSVKTVDGGQVMNNSWHDFDFTKTFNRKDVRAGDTVCGNLMLCGQKTRVEKREHAELVVEAELVFAGHTVTTHQVTTVADAFSCEHELNFVSAAAVDLAVGAQANQIADVEGNVVVPEGSAFIGRVLWAGEAKCGEINVKPQEDKVIIEGVLSANLVYECEERERYSHTAQVPFAVSVKLDGCTPDHNISASVTPMSVNIKARRGKELLVDARLGVNVSHSRERAVTVTSNVVKGAQKPADDSAVVIHVAGAGETLWDIAKRQSVPTAEILRQNPQCAEGVAEGERVVLYKRVI